MKLLCQNEDQICSNCKSEETGLVEVVEKRAGQTVERQTVQTIIMFILDGRTTLCADNMTSAILKKGDFVLFPPGMRFTVSGEDRMSMLLLRINDSTMLCDSYSLKDLYSQVDTSLLEHIHLSSNPIIEVYINLLMSNIRSGFLCPHFLTDKIEELFFYLRAYYTKEQLAGFFLPLMSSDAWFMDFVWKNYRNARNVEHFAKIANCSMATFKKKFRRVVGISPSVWLARQKAMNVYHDLCRTNKNIKEIVAEYHFSSEPHLSTFCRAKLHDTPGHLRAVRK